MSSDEQFDLYEAIARLRDHFAGMVETLDKLVQTKGKAATKDYDVARINWIEKDGTKGKYEFADPKTEGAKPDFKALLADLKAHSGKFQHVGMFYWIFRDAAGIGRKQVTK